MSEKLVIMATHASDDPERATIPFVLATAAQATDVDVSVGLQVDGVTLARKGGADNIKTLDFPPLKDLLDAYLEAGGEIYVCGPCAKSRHITPEDLIPGASIVSAATFVIEFTEATNVLVY